MRFDDWTKQRDVRPVPPGGSAARRCRCALGRHALDGVGPRAFGLTTRLVRGTRCAGLRPVGGKLVVRSMDAQLERVSPARQGVKKVSGTVGTEWKGVLCVTFSISFFDKL